MAAAAAPQPDNAVLILPDREVVFQLTSRCNKRRRARQRPSATLQICHPENAKKRQNENENHDVSSRYLAFKVKTNVPYRYTVRPNQGVLSPGSTISVHITLEKEDATRAREQISSENGFLTDHSFLIESCIVAPDTISWYKDKRGAECVATDDDSTDLQFSREAVSAIWAAVEFGKAATCQQKLAVRHVYLSDNDEDHSCYNKLDVTAASLFKPPSHEWSCIKSGSLVLTPNRQLTFDLGEPAPRTRLSMQHTGETHEHLAFKVKTTHQRRYFAKPNMGIIAPNTTESVVIKLVEEYRDILVGTKGSLIFAGNMYHMLVEYCVVSDDFASSYNSRKSQMIEQSDETFVDAALVNIFETAATKDVTIYRQKLCVGFKKPPRPPLNMPPPPSWPSNMSSDDKMCCISSIWIMLWVSLLCAFLFVHDEQRWSYGYTCGEPPDVDTVDSDPLCLRFEYGEWNLNGSILPLPSRALCRRGDNPTSSEGRDPMYCYQKTGLDWPPAMYLRLFDDACRSNSSGQNCMWKIGKKPEYNLEYWSYYGNTTNLPIGTETWSYLHWDRDHRVRYTQDMKMIECKNFSAECFSDLYKVIEKRRKFGYPALIVFLSPFCCAVLGILFACFVEGFKEATSASTPATRLSRGIVHVGTWAVVISAIVDIGRNAGSMFINLPFSCIWLCATACWLLAASFLIKFAMWKRCNGGRTPAPSNIWTERHKNARIAFLWSSGFVVLWAFPGFSIPMDIFFRLYGGSLDDGSYDSYRYWHVKVSYVVLSGGPCLHY